MSDQPTEPLPTSRAEMSGLGQHILKHWETFRPQYVKSLKAKGQLHQRAEQAAINHAETFSHMRHKGLAPDQAQEIAQQWWIHPESGADPEAAAESGPKPPETSPAKPPATTSVSRPLTELAKAPPAKS